MDLLPCRSGAWSFNRSFSRNLVCFPVHSEIREKPRKRSTCFTSISGVQSHDLMKTWSINLIIRQKLDRFAPYLARCLYFTPFQVYLWCEINVLNEDVCVLAYGRFRTKKFGDTQGRPFNHTPRDIYEEQLTNYTRRNRLFQSDIFNAFSGIHEHLFGSVCSIFDLPGSHFAQALIWQSDRFHRPRFPDKARNLITPSWTWASCEGPIRPYHIGLGKSINVYHTGGCALTKTEGFRQVGADIGVRE